MLDAKPCPTPLSSNTNLSLHDGVALENDSDYRIFVGALPNKKWYPGPTPNQNTEG